MLRKFVVILTMLLCSMATQLYALGLGTVTVESALNQPLRMRIEILQLGDTRLQDIRVGMASNADFERFNIERANFLSNIRFSVESTAQGNVVILTSSQIVREPYLSFILDTRWPNGRLLSEHTVLLDLPVFNDQQSTPAVRQPISPVLQAPDSDEPATAEPFVDAAPAPAVSAPSASSSAANLQPEVIEPAVESPAEVEETAAEETAVEETTAEEAVAEATEIAAEPEPEVAAVEPEPEAVEPEPAAEEPVEAVAEAEPEPEAAIEAAADPIAPEPVEPETIETDASDTLSDIALQVRPDSSVTMQQTMLAIQELNPDAFAEGNINRLRSGQVLRVPSLEEIQAIDPRDAVNEVARQNQDFSETDVQPLAAPADATPTQDDQPQGQLSVVSSDDAIDASGGAAELGSAENAALDQRIAELETQLAQRQEEADRARIEREELASRMSDLEEQIAAAQEIIRLQDIQMAQLQESLAAAAAEAQAAAEQQAIIAAAEIEAAQPVEPPSSLADDILRILTGNAIFMISGVLLAILLLVVLMLRRNRASKLGADDIDEIEEPGFDVAADEPAAAEAQQDDESANEFQDYDPAELDEELDDIIGVSDEADGEQQAEVEDAPEEESLDVLAIVDQLIGEKQYRRALSMLNTSLTEQGEDDEVHAKISEVEALLEGQDAEQRLLDEAAEKEAVASRESETKSFLDDLGIDLDSFDYEEETDEATPVEPVVEDKPADETPAPESEDVDLMFDLGGDDEVDGAGDAASDESSAAEAVEEVSLGDFANESDDEPEQEVEAFEFDLDDDSGKLESEATDPEDIEIDSLEFDADAAEELTAQASADDVADADGDDLETFSFDADAAAEVTEAAEAEADNEQAEQEEDPNAVEFSFDKTEIEDSTEAAEPASNEEVETFDFDLDDDAGDTVLEKPETDAAESADDDMEDFDFDLDEFEIEAAGEEPKEESDDDFLDLDAEADDDVTEILKDAAVSDEIEFDIDEDLDAESDAGDAGEGEELADDDLDFLSADEVEIESVEDDDNDVLSDDDETATKLELAYAYKNMGDNDGAKEILQEVIREGSDEQIAEANKLLETLES